MTTLQESLLRKATACKPKAREDRQEFLTRLLIAVELLEDEDWERLGQEPGGTDAQQWCNDAVDARKAEKELPDFGDDDEKAEEEKEATPVKAAKKKATAKPVKVKAATGQPDGVKVRIKRLVIGDPNISLEDLMGRLTKSGDKMSRMTVSAVRSETRHTLRVLHEQGKLKGVEL
jgi:hypothetical protein